MKIAILLIFTTVYLSASLLDFIYLKDAKEAYKNKEYEKAAKLYGKVDNDEARFNVADALYRQGKYKEALEIFKSIKDEKLLHKKLHNMGNTYANLNDIDNAIKAYEEALKIEFDEDTKYNLDFLKRQKQQKKDNQNQNNRQKNKDKQDKDNQNKSNQNQKNDKDNKNQNTNQKQDNSSKKENKNKDQNHNQTDKKSQKKDQNSNKKEINEKTDHKPPISDMEERKWQKKLNQREINTLMLPLNQKGARDVEKNPW